MNAGRSGMCGVLVTGGFGFIGSHLVERLLPDPNTRVHAVDNMSSSPIDVDAFVRQLAGRERPTYDICGLEDYSTRVSDRHFDEIYHLAAVVAPGGHGGVAWCVRSTSAARASRARVASCCHGSSGRPCGASRSRSTATARWSGHSPTSRTSQTG